MKEPQVIARRAKTRANKINKVPALRLQWHSLKERDAWLKETGAIVLRKYWEEVPGYKWELECGKADCFGVHKHYLAEVQGYMTTRREIKLILHKDKQD